MNKIILAGLLVLLSGGVFAEGAPLLARLSAAEESTKLSATEHERVRGHRGLRGTKSATVVYLDRSALFSTVISIVTPDGKTVVFTKTGGETVDAVVMGTTPDTAKKQQVTTWVGTALGGRARVSLAAGGANSVGMFGTILLPGQRLRIKPVGGAHHVLTEDDPATEPVTGGDDTGGVK